MCVKIVYKYSLGFFSNTSMVCFIIQQSINLSLISPDYEYNRISKWVAFIFTSTTQGLHTTEVVQSIKYLLYCKSH